MPITRIIKTLPSPCTKKDIPVLFHEPHVETGFRQTDQPWHYYLLSLFQIHNECMNAWTHLVGCLLAFSKLYNICKEFDAYNNPWLYPMLAGSITMLTMYLCSFIAHTFHNKSEQLHYTCFFIDYAGIGTFGLGSTIIHYFYCTHPTLVGTWIYKTSIPVAVCLSIMVCVFCSISKTRYARPYPFTRKIWQLSSVASIYSWLMIPIFHRLFIFSYHATNTDWDQSFGDHIWQIVWFVISGFFFGSDIPQRFFPGTFDFLFHSHQIFHVCITIMNLKQIDAMYSDIKIHLTRIQQIEEIPTFYNTFGAVILAGVINIAVIAIFHQIAKERIKRETLAKQKF